MRKSLDITDEQRQEASRRIENFFAFISEVFEDPSLLDSIPSGSRVQAIPREQREPSQRYDIETPRMVATVTPGHDDEQREWTPTATRRTTR